MAIEQEGGGDLGGNWLEARSWSNMFHCYRSKSDLTNRWILTAPFHLALSTFGKQYF